MDDAVPLTAENAPLVESFADLWPPSISVSDMHFYPGTDLVALGVGDSIVTTPSSPTPIFLGVTDNTKVILWNPRTNIGQAAFTSGLGGFDVNNAFSAEFDSLAVSPDGSHIVFVGDKHVLLGTRTGPPGNGIPTFTSQILPAGKIGYSNPDGGAAFSADGRLLAVASTFGDLQVWDVQTGTILGTFKFDNQNGQKECAPLISQGVAFTGDGRSVLSVCLFDLNIGNLATYERTVLPLPGNNIAVFVLSPDGRNVIIGGSSGRVDVWSYPAGELLGDVDLHTRSITSLAFSPNGELVASASQDGTVDLLDAHTWKRLTSLETPADMVAFSPDGRFLVTGGHAGGGKLWGVRSSSSLTARNGVKVILSEGGVSLDPYKLDVPQAWLAPTGTLPRYEIDLSSSWASLTMCMYHSGSDQRTLSRLIAKVTAQIVDLQSGQTVGQKTFTGDDPGECPMTYTFTKDQLFGATIYGGSPDDGQFMIWLKGQMAPLGFH